MGIDPVGVDENNVHSHNRYAYANNNPYKFVDPTGNIAETALDVVSLGLSIQQYRQDPSILNGIGLAYGVIGTAVPILPAGFGIIRSAGKAGASGVEAAAVANRADNAGDAARTGRAKNKLEPDARAEGAHSTYKTGKDGKTTNYATYEPNPLNPSGFDEVKRVDITGRAHRNPDGTVVPTPHVKEAGVNGVRPARREELP